MKKTLKHSLLASLFLLLTSCIWWGADEITGMAVFVQNSSRQPVSQAQVSVTGGLKFERITNESGCARFRGGLGSRVFGESTLTVSANGYKSVTLDFLRNS